MSDEIIETAKATREIAKTAGKAIEATEKLGGFVAKIIKEPLEATIGILTDRLRYIRWERQIRLADRCNEIIGDRNLHRNTRVVAPQLAFPIIQNASLEEDDILQDLWANLLVRAMDASSEIPRRAFIDIIKQLESMDVRLLEFIYSTYLQRRALKKSNFSAEEIKIYKHEILENFEINDNVYKTAIDNLMRVRLVSSYVEESDVETKDPDGSYDFHEVSIHHGYDIICITSFGVSFVRACTSVDYKNHQQLD
jgi:hypothetical protein